MPMPDPDAPPEMSAALEATRETPDPDRTEAAMLAQHTQAVDTVYAVAVGVSRILALPPSGLPRLCVSAACGAVERLQQSPAGAEHLTSALDDLLRALEEAATNAKTLRQLIAAEAHTDKEKP